MKSVAEAPLAYAGLAFCLSIGVFVLYGWLTQAPGERVPSKLAVRRKRSVLRRMGFSAKDE